MLGGLKLENSSEISGSGLFYIKNFRALVGQIFFIFGFFFCFFRRDIVRNLSHQTSGTPFLLKFEDIIFVFLPY